MRQTAWLLLAAAMCMLVGVAAAKNQGTQNMQITKGPVLEMVGDTSAVIAWSTNVPGSTVVKYGTDPNNLTQTAEAPGTEPRTASPSLACSRGLLTTTSCSLDRRRGRGRAL